MGGNKLFSTQIHKRGRRTENEGHKGHRHMEKNNKRTEVLP
jgi:hypothetical protein